MTYDNTDADSDGVIEADIDNDLVNTDEVFDNPDVVLGSDDDYGDAQNKLDDLAGRGSGLAYLSGALNVGDNRLTVPRHITLWGGGRLKKEGNDAFGSRIVGDNDNDGVLRIERGADVRGIAVWNQSPTGDAVRQAEYSDIEGCHLSAYNALVRFEADSGTDTAEMRVEDCTLTSDGPAEFGILLPSGTDCSDNEFHHNIMRGCKVMVRDRGGGATHLSHNHAYWNTYGHEITFDLKGESTVRHNQIDTPSIVGIRCERNDIDIEHNKFFVKDGADGVQFDPENSGDLLRVNIRRNEFNSKTGTMDTAVTERNAGDITGCFKTRIEDNTYDAVSNKGFRTEARGTATLSGTGSKKDFTFSHPLGTLSPEFANEGEINVTPHSNPAFFNDLTGQRFVDSGSDGLLDSAEIHFAQAPPDGTDNLEVVWRVQNTKGFD